MNEADERIDKLRIRFEAKGKAVNEQARRLALYPKLVHALEEMFDAWSPLKGIPSQREAIQHARQVLAEAKGE